MQNQTGCPCPQKLYRSKNNQIIAGVAGGIGERYRVDPNIIRIIFILLGMLFGFGVVIYLFLWLLIPSQPQIQQPETQIIQSNVKTMSAKIKSWSKILAGDENSLKIILSIVVIIVGLVILVVSGISLVEFFAFSPLILLLIIALLVLFFLIG